ncbi:ly6/PLAUR domain-containing protein 8-like [Carassius gibelio]|uniref:ly6/PLAUR domain-containing protein 8-like n=1 Tax=Carassius gibelio TaxID=101364 RepID=UPI002277D5F0|nr:ly6/PLAUR domain-containing protein 8-like [Carassius gibelio]
MALKIISVVLFTVFFSEAVTLMCYKCTTPVPYGTCTTTANCSQNEQCNSITNTTYHGTGSSNKMCSASCANRSVNVGMLSYTSQCCASDLCNNTADSSNGKMCYICIDTNCSTNRTLDCKGDEDKCITGTATLNGVNTTLKGCASKNFCDNYNVLVLNLIKIYNVSCHDAGLRNSAQSLTQGAMLLLVPILHMLFSICDLFYEVLL